MGLCMAAVSVVEHLTLLLPEAQRNWQLLLSTLLRVVWRSLRSVLRLGGLGGVSSSESARQYASEDHYQWEVPDDTFVPHSLLCPITRELFVKPVILRGMVFEERAARRWVQQTRRHPVLLD